MCIDECLRRIAARLCLLEDHAPQATEHHVDATAGPGSGDFAVDVQASSCNAGTFGIAACCDVSKSSHGSGESDPCSEDRAAIASTCCPSDRPRDACHGESNAKTMTESSCCKQTTMSQTMAEKDDCCGGRDTSTQTTLDALRDCSDACCEFAGEEDTALSSGACSSHLRTAFDRFEALIRQSKCICRSVVEQLGFCCCALSSDGQVTNSRACTGHSGPQIGTPKTRQLKTTGTTESPCSDGCCPSPKVIRGDVVPKAPSNDRDCVAGCCAEKKQSQCNMPDQNCDRRDGCCNEKTQSICKTSGQNQACDVGSTTCTEQVGTCGDENPKQQAIETTVDRGMNTDLEHGTTREYVVLSVSGMTCTGCSTKMRNVLDAMPGLYKPRVTFVSGTAAFELDGDVAMLDEVLPLIERRTGFKCSRIVEGYQHLDLQMTPQKAKELEDACHEGIVSIIQTKQKFYRVTYNPFVVGARDVIPPGASLAPPDADPSITKDNKRLLMMTWYTIVAATLTIPVVVLNWAPNPVSVQTRGITSLILATCVQAIAVPEFYTQAIKSLVFSKVIEMDMLVVISITAAYAYSVVAFALTEAGVDLEQEAFFETSALLITLVLFGRLIAAIARVRAIRAVSLRSLQVDMTTLLQPEDQKLEIDSRLLHFGDVIVVRSHSRIVTDGTVVSGVSAVDESMLTGEAIPVTKQHGNPVIAGTVNGEGVLHIRISRLPGANSVSDIAKSVEDALAAKPRIQDLADQVASWFVPVVVAIAIVVFAIWFGIALGVQDQNGGGAVGTAITYAIAVLAVSCPCALGLAVPMVLVIAGGVAARQGVVIKAADATERAFKVTDVVFDKTGTLTKGDLRVVRLEVLSDGTARDEALALAKSLVKDDSHPVSRAVAAYLSEITLDVMPLDHAKSIPGSGIQAACNDRVVKAGNPFWLGIENNAVVTEILGHGMTCFCVKVDEVAILAVGLQSTLRDEAEATISTLRNRNITTHIVSGDHARAVEALALSLDVELANVASRHSPLQKKEYVSALQANGKVVLFCGDGTNDAVALAQANVGAQLGSTSDVAGAVADVVLLRGLDGVLVLLDVSRRAYVRIVFNFVWSAVYNVFAILLAAGAFVKFRIPPAYAGLGEIVSVGPVILAAVSMLLVGGRYPSR